NEALSFVVNCATQKEIDYFWKKLSAGGKEVQCGWLKDKFGLSWQIVPEGVVELFDSKDPARAERVMKAMLGMVKLDIAKLKQAYRGETHQQSPSIGRHEKRRVRFDSRRQAPELGNQRPALRGLGDLSHERIAGGSESHLRVANERLVRPGHPALG